MKIPETAMLKRVYINLKNEKLTGCDDYFRPCDVNLDDDKTYFFKHKDKLYIKTAKRLYEIVEEKKQSTDLFFDKYDVQKITGFSTVHSLRIIKKMNDELKKQNFKTIGGLVPKEYFLKTYGLTEEVKK